MAGGYPTQMTDLENFGATPKLGLHVGKPLIFRDSVVPWHIDTLKHVPTKLCLVKYCDNK